MEVSLLDWIYPKRCVGCGKEGEYVCRDCEVGVWEEEQICPSCGRKSKDGSRHSWCKDRGLDGLVCLWAYEGLVRKIIGTVKYKYYFGALDGVWPNREVIRKREDLQEWLKYTLAGPVIVPVPLSGRRMRERGFNQAELIARRVASEWGLATKTMLSRIKETGRQVGRSRQERLDSMRGAFRLTGSERYDKVILVDDVWTTGATLREAGGILKEGGVRQVWGWVLAR